MLNLLLNASIFVSVQNDFYVQLTGLTVIYQANWKGTSLVDIPPLPQSAHTTDENNHGAYLQLTGLKRKKSGHTRLQSRKKRKTLNSETDESRTKTPNELIFARSRIFYARPPKSLRGNVIFGLRKERTTIILYPADSRCLKSISRSEGHRSFKAYYEIHFSKAVRTAQCIHACH